MPMTEAPKSFFAGVNTKRGSLDANYIRSGHYWMIIRKCKVDETRRHERFAANELQVIRVFDDDNGMGHRLGEEVTHFIANFGPQADYFLGTINGFISASIGCTPEEVTEELANEVYNLAKQPLAGTVIEVAARNIVKQNAPNPNDKKSQFTRVNYRRFVPFKEVNATLSAEDKARFFPGDILQRAMATER